MLSFLFNYKHNLSLTNALSNKSGFVHFVVTLFNREIDKIGFRSFKTINKPDNFPPVGKNNVTVL